MQLHAARPVSHTVPQHTTLTHNKQVDAQLGKATGKGGAGEQVNTFVTSSPAVCSVLIISYETYVAAVV